MNQLIEVNNVMHNLLDISMTIVVISLLLVPMTILSGISVILSIFFWVGRIKREVDQNHEGSLKGYVKNLFNNRSK